MSGLATNQNTILANLYQRPASDVTLDTLVEETGIVRGEVVKAVGQLCSRELVDRLEKATYQITPEGMATVETGKPIRSGPRSSQTGKQATRNPDNYRQRAWNVMRMGEAFDLATLASTVSDDGSTRPYETLRKFCKGLRVVGYLHQLPTVRVGNRPGSNGHTRYRLANDTGEFAPSVNERPFRVFDNNTGKVAQCV